MPNFPLCILAFTIARFDCTLKMTYSLFKDPIRMRWIKIKDKCYHSYFILSGTLEINDQQFTQGDFLIIDNESNLELVTVNNAKVFEIVSPISLHYKTYAEIHKIS